MSKKVFGTVLSVVGIAALGVATFGVGSAIVTAGLVAGGVVATQVGRGLLAAAAAADAKRSARVENLETRVDPLADAIWCFGETAIPTQIVYAEVFGAEKEKALQILAGCFHPVDSFGDFFVEDEQVSFTGVEATGAWAGALERHTRLGGDIQSAISITGSSWPVDAEGKGLAHIGLLWKNMREHEKLQGRIPRRITQVVKGAPVYDPRQDSTAGGTGTQRADDQTTWEYGTGTAPAGSNWALVVLHYLLGWRQNGKLAYGRGADPADIDMASFIAAANVCDQTVDGIPRYHVGGAIRLDGDHARVVGELEATVGGKLAKVGGKYFIWAPHDDLVADWTIREDDLLRDAGVEFRDARPIEQLFNTAVGDYIDPADLYLPAPYPEVVEDAAVTDDEGERLLTYDTPHLTSAARAERVARQQVRRSRFGGRWTVGVGPEFLNAQVFDIVDLSVQETNNVSVLTRIVGKVVSLTGAVILTVEEEDAAIYDFSLPLGSRGPRQSPPGADDEAVFLFEDKISLVIVVDKIAGDRVRVEYTADRRAKSIIREDAGGGNRVVPVPNGHSGSEEIALTDTVQSFQAAANTQPNGAGIDSSFVVFHLGRRLEDDPMRPLVDVDFVSEVERADGKMVTTFTISGSPGPEGVGPISVRWRSRALDAPDTAFGLFQPSPQTVEIVRAKGEFHRLLAQARDDATGIISFTAEVTVGQVGFELGIPGISPPRLPSDPLVLEFPQSGGIPGPNIFTIPEVLDDLGLVNIFREDGTVGSGALLPSSGAPLIDIESDLAVLPGPALEFSGTIVAGAVIAGTIVAQNMILDGQITLTDGTRKLTLTGSTIDMLGGQARFSGAASIGATDPATRIDDAGVKVFVSDGTETETHGKYGAGSLTLFNESAGTLTDADIFVNTAGLVLKMVTNASARRFKLSHAAHTNDAFIAGVVVDTVAPTGDYPDGTLWCEV